MVLIKIYQWPQSLKIDLL